MCTSLQNRGCQISSGVSRCHTLDAFFFPFQWCQGPLSAQQRMYSLHIQCHTDRTMCVLVKFAIFLKKRSKKKKKKNQEKPTKIRKEKEIFTERLESKTTVSQCCVSVDLGEIRLQQTGERVRAGAGGVFVRGGRLVGVARCNGKCAPTKEAMLVFFFFF